MIKLLKALKDEKVQKCIFICDKLIEGNRDVETANKLKECAKFISESVKSLPDLELCVRMIDTLIQSGAFDQASSSLIRI